jgi:hypothetical protein
MKSKLSSVVVTNTVPHEEKKKACAKLRTIDISSTVSHSLYLSTQGEKPDMASNSSRKHAGEHTMAKACPTSSLTLWLDGLLALFGVERRVLGGTCFLYEDGFRKYPL